MRFIQYLDGDGNQRVGCTSTDAGRVRRLDGVASTVALAQAAFAHALPMEQMAELRLGALEPTPLARMLESLRVLTPLMHDDPSRCLVTGTGLTHLGSAATRDAMHHKVNAQEEAALTDSMRMFKWGLEGGRPATGAAGVQPEWFYKGDGALNFQRNYKRMQVPVLKTVMDWSLRLGAAPVRQFLPAEARYQPFTDDKAPVEQLIDSLIFDQIK